MGLFLRKNHILRCWGWLSLLNGIGVLTLSLLLKLPPRKLEPWFVLWSFFLLRLLCFYINLPYDRVWNTVAMSGLVLLVLELLDKLEKRICRTGDPSLAASLEPFAHRNLASLSLFFRHYFGRSSSELAQLVPLPYFRWRSICYSDRLHDFLSLFLDVTRMSMSTVCLLLQLDSGILCPQNAFLWPVTLVALSLELTDIF